MTAEERATKNDVEKIVKKLQTLPLKYQSKALKKVMRFASKPLTKQAKANVNKSKEPTHRYIDGKIVATYYPANLRRSIGVLALRRVMNAIYVGPRKRKGDSKGEFKGSKFDPYYAAMVEKGTIHQDGQHYMERAYRATRGLVVNRIQEGVNRILKNWERANKISIK